MKISLIITIFNEAKTIERLLNTINTQTRKPDELVIVDGGSTDNTLELIHKAKSKINFPIKIDVKKGNRSVGRNEAIAQSQYDWIAITDAGCLLKDDWLEQLVNCQTKTNSEVIAGNQLGLPQTAFEEAVIPYVLVMQDRINEKTYLPATRSVLMKKKIWKELNGFDQKLSLNEDYEFFKRVQKNNYTISFCRKSIIFWLPRNNLLDFYRMIKNFATGDAQASITRPKIYFLFFRYFILALFLLLFSLTHNYRILHIIIFGMVIYLLWATLKNMRYVPRGWYWLPVLQLTADLAVMLGTIKGVLLHKL